VLGVPTETVYGLAGNALCEAAVRAIFEVKGRPFIDPLIVHFPSIEAAATHVELSDRARELAARFWPGALTLVVPKKPSIPDLVTAGLPSVAIRVPGHPVFRALLRQLDFPLAAPSANPFGYVSPTLAAHVQTTLGMRIPAVLDGGACQHGLESTIVDLRDPGAARILRPGPIGAEALGIRNTGTLQAANDGSAQAAPGMLTQHYSPNTAITLFAHSAEPEDIKDGEAVLYNTKPAADNLKPHSYWLSESGEPAEIAHNLFMLIQKLDNADYHKLHVECAEDDGIGVAVNDRLRRAAAKRG
jgi:L-threonylcarbamoyladenylate synthase